jgi:hypothetical protein
MPFSNHAQKKHKKKQKSSAVKATLSDPYDFGESLQFVESTAPSQLAAMRAKFPPINRFTAPQPNNKSIGKRKLSTNTNDELNVNKNNSDELFDASIVSFDSKIKKHSVL